MAKSAGQPLASLRVNFPSAKGRLAFAVGGNNLKAEKTAVVREEEEKRGRLLSAEDSPFSPPRGRQFEIGRKK